MNPQTVVARLAAMHTEVQRSMPHVGCGGMNAVEPDIALECYCYKCGLLRAIRDAEMKVRQVSGLPLF